MKPPRPDLKMGDLADGKIVTKIDPESGEIKLTDLSGIIALADAIPDMGLSVNLLENVIDTYHAEALVSILKEHPTLKSLKCTKGVLHQLISGGMCSAEKKRAAAERLEQERQQAMAAARQVRDMHMLDCI
jgi:hypothetical protein